MPRAADLALQLDTPALRASAVEQVVDYLDQAQIQGSGVIRIQITVEADAVEEWTLAFGPDSVDIVAADQAQATVRLRLSDLVQLANGDADGALLYLSGALDVVGDEKLVLDLGRVVRRPGTGCPLIDPEALDPIAVSDAIGHASTEHLARVMSGGFRELVLSEVFRRLPDFLIAEKAERVRVTVGFEIEYDEGGTKVDRYVVRIADGACTVESRAAADAPVDATLVLAGHEFLRLVLGHLNPVRGVMSGQLRVRGHVIKALGFNSVMRIPGS